MVQGLELQKIMQCVMPAHTGETKSLKTCLFIYLFIHIDTNNWGVKRTRSILLSKAFRAIILTKKSQTHQLTNNT